MNSGPSGKLAEATALIVGVGALGSATAELLARAGIGALILQDFDIVQESNLPRQTLYTTEDIGKKKVEAAKRRLGKISPACKITTRCEPFSGETSVDGTDIIVDGTDSLHARLVLNDAAKKHGVPLVIGTAAGTRGMIFAVGSDACWQCVAGRKTATDTCADGILVAAAHAVASVQAAVALRALSGEPCPHLIEIDVWEPGMRKICVKRSPQCDACRGAYRYLDAPFELTFCGNSGKLQARPTAPRKIDLSRFDNVVRNYETAVLVAVENGTALVHQHGLVEFDSVPEESARAFALSVTQ